MLYKYQVNLKSYGKKTLLLNQRLKSYHICKSQKKLYMLDIYRLSLFLCGSRFLKKIINISSFKSPYHSLADREKLILPLEKYFKTLKDLIIGTLGT